MTDTVKNQLQYILNLSKVNHSDEILKEESVKHAHIYCKINQLSGQVTGPLIESYIKEKYNMIKNNASLCIGDLQHNNVNIEVKASNGGKNNKKFNFVQLRMNHSCEYLLTAYHISEENIEQMGELFMFKIKKDTLRDLIFQFGGYAHGTIEKLGKITIEDLQDVTNDKEYAIRPSYGDKCWNALLPFRVEENTI
tara:strand:+ start:13463 stop:14047 length:585 start_codon:yes stop_codon:yes gene_type:complete